MNSYSRIIPLLVLAGLLGCTPKVDFDLQGHRGARGLLPENSIPSFLMASDLGVNTIEMDVVVAADSQVVVSHDPQMSAGICSHPDGTPVTEEDEQVLTLFTMSYEQIAAFDCGIRGNERFPDQESLSVQKPLLIDALRAIEAHSEVPLRYNIEIKSKEEGDGVLHPDVGTFAELVYEVLDELGLMDRAIVQSFDPRALEAFKLLEPEATLAFLVSNEMGFEPNMGRLSFRPQIYSPNHKLVDQSLVDSVHGLGMTIVPWTVNETDRMEELLILGVDGLITDYPDRGAALKP
ncbi:MAG: glycerophosphodiester phosphodiesterase family protein [Rhodothermales bacterium]|jgi:glycerophosphoryl diester phosphodiesterase|nr:glycerophosphodiester phosphodiesterase family protein [Rhodothermales bacterium]